MNVNTVLVLTRVFSLVMPAKRSEESFRFLLFRYIEKLERLFLNNNNNNHNNNNNSEKII